MAVAVPLGRLGSRPAFRDQLDVDLQSRPPEHGLGRIYTKTAVGHGRLVSTSEPRGKRGDYHRVYQIRAHVCEEAKKPPIEQKADSKCFTQAKALLARNS